ncbi:MAG TPA: TIGR03435 family protein [Bryobacteraceae bacterium]|nr:TIGR03435 family protein [Bryobacteraceae bacterium]
MFRDLAIAACLAAWLTAAKASPLSFEVASVKPAAACCAAGQWRESKAENDRLDFRYVTLKYCIAFSYGIKEFQVSGPGWLGEARYDIVAKGPLGTKREQLPEMMQALLAERFKLEVHHEKKEFRVFALLAGKPSAKLKPTPDDPGGPGGAAFGFSMSASGVGRLEARHCDMTALAKTLPRLVGGPVMDESRIQGRYDFELEFSPEDINRMGLPDVPAAAAEPAVSIFTSLQQIGLKLEPRKVPLDTVVVDKAAKIASEN